MSNAVCAFVPPRGLCFHLGLSREYCSFIAISTVLFFAVPCLMLWHFVIDMLSYTNKFGLAFFFFRAVSLAHVLQQCKWLRFAKQNSLDCVIISVGFGQHCPIKSFPLGPAFVKLLFDSLTVLQRTWQGFYICFMFVGLNFQRFKI